MKKTVIDGRRVDISRGQIIMPPNPLSTLFDLSIPDEQDLFVESSSQLRPLGTKLVLDEAIYRYCRAGAAIAAGMRGFLKCFYNLCPGKATNNQHMGFEGALYANVAAGATSFQIADTVAAVHEYEGAYFVVYDDTNNIYASYRVIDNDVSDGSTTTCYIASPGFKNALTTSMGITVYLSPYRDIRSFADGGGYASAAGFAKFGISSGYYFWLQTAGRISGITGASTWPGQTAYNRDVFANTDGSVIGADDTAARLYYQRIGYLLERTASDYGDNYIMLQLDQ